MRDILTCCSMPEPTSARSDEEALWRRYGRQMALPDWGLAAQQALQRSRVLIVGLGGIGSASAQYLAAAGVGNIWLSDGDRLELSNLQRQILYSSNDQGQEKCRLAERRLKLLNPLCRLHGLPAVDDTRIEAALCPDGNPVDLVLDGCDNQSTRLLLNRHCYARQIPLLSAAATGWLGQLAFWNFRSPAPEAAGCYQCLYPEQTELAQSCSEFGIPGPLAGLIGCQQALEALKFLGGQRSALVGQCWRFDGLSGRWWHLQLPVDPACPVCAAGRQEH